MTANGGSADGHEADGPATDASSIELQLLIDGVPVEVAWAENEAVAELAQRAAKGPIEVQLSPYGGFEQVGPLGFDLPRDDVETVTQPGDIMLYSGSQVVVFFGKNSWAYTRLGRITDKTAGELADLLGGEAVTLTIEVSG